MFNPQSPANDTFPISGKRKCDTRVARELGNNRHCRKTTLKPLEFTANLGEKGFCKTRAR